MTAKKPVKLGKEPNTEVTKLQAALVPITQSAGPLVHWSQVRALTSAEQFADCAKALATVKELFDQAETQRKAITGPLNGVIKHVNSTAKALTTPLEELGTHLKQLVLGYEEVERRRRIAEAEKAARAAEKAGAKEVAADIREQAETAVALPGGTQLTMRDNWTAEITNKLAFLKWVLESPRDRMQYVELSPAPLIAISKAMKGSAAEIPGVEWLNKRIVVNG